MIPWVKGVVRVWLGDASAYMASCGFLAWLPTIQTPGGSFHMAAPAFSHQVVGLQEGAFQVVKAEAADLLELSFRIVTLLVKQATEPALI